MPQQTLTEFASQPVLAPVNALNMKAVLDRDFDPLKQSGAFVRGGVSIGIMTHGVREVFAYGAAKPQSIFEIGSVTKTFTALTLAQMVQQVFVKLDEPVRELLSPPVEKPYGSEITLLDLATHHSGLPRMPQSFHSEGKDNPFADFGTVEMFGYMATHGVKKPADASFLYSNLGVGLLGQLLLADRAHMSYADLVKTEVTDPLGLKDTVVVLSPQQRGRLLS